MEITTCEQYVLAKLKEANATIEMLQDTIDELQRKNGSLEVRLQILNSPDNLERRINDIGRCEVYRSWFYQGLNVGDSTFEDWCVDSAKDYSARPRDISKRQAIEFFKAELRADYDEQKAIESAEADDKEDAE